jgi:hypothetical protein
MADIPFRERIFCTINEAAQATGSGRSKRTPEASGHDRLH